MRRRDFIKVLAGSAMTWPLAARAQQSEPMRRIGVLMAVTADQPLGQSGLAVFQQRLQQLGWNDGRNVRFDIRWGENDVDRNRKDATELVSLSPDVILAMGTQGMTALQRVTSSCQSCSLRFLIRLALASSIHCPGQVATPRALCCLNIAWSGSG